MADSEDYEIGYGRPPKVHRFKKGDSGNPRGRRKGSQNLATIFREEANTLVQINSPGGPSKITKERAAIRQLINQAAKGNASASKHFFDLLMKLRDPDGLDGTPLSLQEQDRIAMESLKARIKEFVSEDESLPSATTDEDLS